MTGSNVQIFNGIVLLSIFFVVRIICGNYQSLALYQDLWTSYSHYRSTNGIDFGIVGPEHEIRSHTFQAATMNLTHQTDYVPLWLALSTFLAIAALNVLNVLWLYKLIRSMNRRFIVAKPQREKYVNEVRA